MLDTATAATVVGTVVATDPTVDEALTYTIESQDPNGFFTIGSATGALSLARAVSDSDGHFFHVNVRVTDRLGQADTARVTITPRANPAPAPGNLVVTGENQDKHQHRVGRRSPHHQVPGELPGPGGRHLALAGRRAADGNILHAERAVLRQQPPVPGVGPGRRGDLQRQMGDPDCGPDRCHR